MNNSVIVSLRDIVVEFDGQRILDGLNLDIHDKEFVTLLGSSGCGKNHHPPPHRGLSGTDVRQSAAERRGHHRRTALQAPGEHRVPEIRAVAPT